ncbi:hypothetical protein MPH_13997 [Macrophomina phaseolina MS6]|uniref:Fungal-type protein kinase domain-containing protein n=1 Tax=Macrophomina phaseolina (strain MS6) TaxID=1126212 RepID=K2RG45_MACPH|nr:hypothetical protein MPH_13997 [Macrophomina phaseolina MS6]
MAQLSDSQLATIRDHPIGDALDSFRAAFKSAPPRTRLRGEIDHFQQLVAQPARKSLVLQLINTFQIHPAALNLPSHSKQGPLLSDIAMLYIRLSTNQTDVKHTAQLVKNIIDEQDDPTIWTAVYDLIRQTQPAAPTFARPTAPASATLPITPKRTQSTTSAQQTPNTRTTSVIVNSSEQRKLFDDVLRAELDGSLFAGVPNFFETFFGEVENLEQTAATIFQKCSEGTNPLYTADRGWRGWPGSSTQNNVLGWFTRLVKQLKTLAEKHCSVGTIQRGTLAKPDLPLEGSVAERKMDLGFADTMAHGRPRWSQILVVGELKSNPGLDGSSETWRDLARYAREVFTAQDTRRFVLGFTLCGPTMRLWEFDRLGGIASEQFNVNNDGKRLVSVIMGYLLMDKKQLGFDPTILEADGKRWIEIKRNNRTERLVLDEVITRAPCVVGRATTCWKAYREGNKSRRPYVIKDSWQYPERDEEGELLKEATKKEVVNVARHYHHETVCVSGTEDDIYNNIRKGLDVSKATNYRPSESMPPPSTSGIVRDTRSTSSAGQKRSSSYIDASEPVSKRICSDSRVTVRGELPKNRVHRRVITLDYGKPIYKASSRAALLAAMEGCIKGHQSLHKKGKMLQRDVSKNNLMINEDSSNPSWDAFLIDLDLAISKEREGVSGAKGKTGTLAFMAIGVLLGEQHSFMHDLESFFWVLFWICIHYEGPGKGRVVKRFDKWNYTDPEELAEMKKGLVSDGTDFLNTLVECFTPYYQQLVPWVNELRKAVFPNGGRWKQEEPELYSRMMDILRKAREDSRVLRGA